MVDLLNIILENKRKVAEYGPAIERIYLGKNQLTKLIDSCGPLFPMSEAEKQKYPYSTFAGVRVIPVDEENWLEIIWRDSVTGLLFIKTEVRSYESNL